MSEATGIPQWLRKCTLTVQYGNQLLDLSNMQFKFQVASIANPVPATLSARVYNLSASTANKIKSLTPAPDTIIGAGQAADPSKAIVTLMAGYEGNSGVIFRGEFLQGVDGRETAVDTYVDLIAGDGDWAHSWGIINTTIASGWKGSDAAKAIGDVYQAAGVAVTALPQAANAMAAPRGKVMHGMVRDSLRQFTASNNGYAYVQNGQLRWMLPQSPYKPDQAVVVNTDTGMIGWPQQNTFGIEVRMLLNASVGVGTLLKLKQGDIQKALNSPSPDNNQQNIFNAGDLSKDGLYQVLQVEHIGDTRGTEWYTTCLCMAVNPARPDAQNTEPVQNYFGYFGWPTA